MASRSQVSYASSEDVSSLPVLPLRPTAILDAQDNQVENALTIFPALVDVVFSWINTEREEEALLGDDCAWMYRFAYYNYNRPQSSYEGIRNNLYSTASVVAGIRSRFRGLSKVCHVVVTYEKYKEAWTFVKDASNEADGYTPCIYISVMFLELLGLAPTAEEQHHILHYAFISIMQCLEHVYVRYLHGNEAEISQIPGPCQHKLGDEEEWRAGQLIGCEVLGEHAMGLPHPIHGDVGLAALGFRIFRSDKAVMNDKYVQELNASLISRGYHPPAGRPLHFHVYFENLLTKKGLPVVPTFITDARKRLAFGDEQSVPRSYDTFSSYMVNPRTPSTATETIASSHALSEPEYLQQLAQASSSQSSDAAHSELTAAFAKLNGQDVEHFRRNQIRNWCGTHRM